MAELRTLSVARRVFVAIVAFVFTFVLSFGNITQALACTAIYFGSETTANGSVIWGRSEDISQNYGKLYTVHPAETHAPGETVTFDGGYVFTYPEETLRYTLVRDSRYNENSTQESYAEAGINEKNVAISATVTLSGGNAAVTGNTGTDPMVSGRNGGIAERSLTTVVLMQATSARHGVEILAEICDTTGSAERNGIMISDPQEVWFMQILSGHQYIAVKAPADKVAFSPNVTMMNEVDLTSPDVIASPGLVKTAVDAETFVAGLNDNPAALNAVDGHTTIMVAASYAATSARNVSGRMYLGYYYLLGAQAAKDMQAAHTADPAFFDFYIDPRTTGKYDLYEAMRFLAFHGNKDDAADGRYVAPVTGNSNAIGNQGTVEAHLFETRADMPQALATIEWLALAPAEFSLYIPGYGSLITETDAHYAGYESPKEERDYENAYWVFRDIYTQVNANRDVLEPVIAPVLEAYQKSLIAQQPAVDTAMVRLYNADTARAGQMATELNRSLCIQAFDFATSLRADVTAWSDAGKPADFALSSATLALATPDYSFIGVSAAAGIPDSSDLDAGIHEAAEALDALSGSSYTSPKAEAFTQAYAKAQETFADENATQAEMDAALEALNSAYETLGYNSESYALGGTLSTGYALGSSADAVITFARDISLFSGAIKLDGKLLTEGKDYKVEAGSTKVSISSTYLNTLGKGSHTITADFVNGTLSAGFTTFAAGEGQDDEDDKTATENSTLPGTGDTALLPMAFVGVIALLGAAAFVTAFAARRRAARGRRAI
ncbi:MAG: C69 family dipeptidase [Coriobacteriales bacterium]|jgi:dipeptidase|nr:C69 family dipeptidase [Coriobacteriales bacterium]